MATMFGMYPFLIKLYAANYAIPHDLSGQTLTVEYRPDRDPHTGPYRMTRTGTPAQQTFH